MKKIKISRQAYRLAKQANLMAFAENVLARLRGGNFELPDALVQGLDKSCNQYRMALAGAVGGGRAAVAAKQTAQNDLLASLDALATALEAQPDLNAQRVIEAGFELPPTKANFNGVLPVPEVFRAGSTGRRGQLRVQLGYVLHRLVHTFALEYSPDDGATWVSGFYQRRRTFVLEGLPSSLKLLLRVRAVGGENRHSAWTEPIAVAVL